MASFQASYIGLGVSLITPSADGSANQAIITNGSGTLSFATIPLFGLTGASVSGANVTLGGTLSTGATTLSGGTVTASTPTLTKSQTWNNAAITFIGATTNITDTASASGSLIERWQVGGVDKVTIDKVGSIFTTARLKAAGQIFAGTGGLYFSQGTRCGIDSTVDGVIVLYNNAANDFSRLQLGGTTSAFPSIKRNGTAINFRLADDSADAPITAGAATFSGNVFVGAFTVATLPSAAANDGATARVTDSSVAASGNYGATVAGGGANKVRVFSNGTNWVIA